MLLHILNVKKRMIRIKNNTVPYKCVSILQSLYRTINSCFIYLLSCHVASVTVSCDKPEKTYTIKTI